MSDKIPSFDLDTLLSDISAEDPAGPDLRRSPTYDQLKELRREDDSSIDHGIWQTEVKTANWDGVITLGLEALSTQSETPRISPSTALMCVSSQKSLPMSYRLTFQANSTPPSAAGMYCSAAVMLSADRPAPDSSVV